MSLTSQHKQQLIQDFRTGDSDSGSAQVQIALLSARISELTEHFRTHSTDYSSRRGLLAMVSRRRSLLDYLKRKNPERYLEIIRRLEIRK